MEAVLSLAEAQRSQYEQSGASAALDEAISLGEEAVAELRPGHTQRPRAQAGLASSLLLRFRRTKSREDLIAAIALGESATAATPPGHVHLAGRLCTLASALLSRYDDEPGDQNLATAVDAAEAALDATPAGHSERAQALSLAGKAWHRAGAPDEAAGALREAVSLTPAGDPRLADRAVELATVLAETTETTEEAHRVAEMAAAVEDAAPTIRLRAASTLGKIEAARRDWQAAAEAFGRAVRLLPLVAPRNLTRADLEHRLGALGHVSCDAAAVALHAGDPPAALENLELGRATLLSYVMDARQDIAELRAVDNVLADEWERLRDQLDGGISFGLHPDLRIRLAAASADLLGRIRRLPGQEKFLRPPSAAQLAETATEGPVVCLNVSKFRCDALVLTTTGVEVVPLPGLTETESAKRLDEFLDATKVIGDGAVGKIRLSAEGTIADTLAWLWDTTVEPVLTALGHTASHQPGRPWPRLWWLPTGPMNFLPLHAAGHPDSGPSALDRVVSSFTPSIRSLAYTRRPAAPGAGRRLLGVGVSHVPGRPALPEAGAEARRAITLTGEHGNVLYDSSRESVRAALPWASWVHFACHAETRPAEPSASGLQLWDGPLTVAEISTLNLADAELAFLSACSTARGAQELADESIHLASAFQLAGYRHVIATLWPCIDSTATQVSDRFYREVARAVPFGLALHSAVSGLRERYPNIPSVWAGHLHVGP
ncbi:CHAT domain-containing protein [Amycolatopsis sp. cmx-4-54]|uniref:CHAT domain-containing protein n=1 Tax=Amycolatopsis sp. cmx-4-54 TaxID=2790936 RepID=UPI00397E05DC